MAGNASAGTTSTVESVPQGVSMTADMSDSIRASRMHVARSRGALSGVLLVILGAWAAIVPFIGPYLSFAFTPAPTSKWYWTAARGYFEVAPGAAAFVGGVLLLVSAHRLMTSFGAWLAAVGGAWLIIGLPLSNYIGINTGSPAASPLTSPGVYTLELLFFFYAIGAAILFVAAVAIGRMSTHSVRDVRAAERRAESEAAAAEAARADERRAADERRVAGERRAAEERRLAEGRGATAGSGGAPQAERRAPRNAGGPPPAGARDDGRAYPGATAAEGQPTQAMPQYPPPEQRAP
jgi:hypothetical protein